ncbi:MAG: DNA repair protein RecO C-terminal domain-containing protein [Treponema sp.]|nr:DNA repair protein RecO C-terminal domain-containing protein [Treponema sp.]
MARNSSSEVLVLSIAPKGETNRNATLFSQENGITFATVYGGPKSKLRSLVSPYNRGIIYLYTDSVRKTTKVIDFDVTNYHPSFRESIFKSWAAALSVELLVKTKCAGSPQESWTLINGFLDGLELSNEENGRIGMIRFIWRYLGILGIRPDSTQCVRCGTSFFHENKILSDNIPIAFSTIENGFICPHCQSSTDSGLLYMQAAAVHYLSATAILEPKIVRTIPVTVSMVQEMKQLTFTLIHIATGIRLKSIESGIGIL